MRKILCFHVLLMLSAVGVRAQMVQDASYRVIGHVKGIPMEWAALYFFFR
ncbi:MAG: hypothetical protein IKP15_07995 [Bacteroidales bacterium]|nr:hypothetical protein [Bacteroidales bacterium]